MDYVAGRVASFKQVRHIEFIDEIPKSLSGKILRRVLREREEKAELADDPTWLASQDHVFT